jgi:hypothetical protein
LQEGKDNESPPEHFLLKQLPALIAFANERGGGDFDSGLSAEEIQQDSDALSGGHNSSDDGAQAVEGTPGYFHCFIRCKLLSKHMYFVSTYGGPEVINHLIGNGWPATAKMDYALDAAGVMELANARCEIEPRKKITGKERLGEPDRATPGGPLEANAGKVNFETKFLFERGCRNMFVLGLGTKAIPRQPT